MSKHAIRISKAIDAKPYKNSEVKHFGDYRRAYLQKLNKKAADK